jgi:hypothetical protein
MSDFQQVSPHICIIRAEFRAVEIQCSRIIVGGHLVKVMHFLFGKRASFIVFGEDSVTLQILRIDAIVLAF